MIVAITDDDVDLEISSGVVTTWMKLAVRDRIEDVADDDHAADEDDSDYADETSGAVELSDRPAPKAEGN